MIHSLCNQITIEIDLSRKSLQLWFKRTGILFLLILLAKLTDLPFRDDKNCSVRTSKKKGKIKHVFFGLKKDQPTSFQISFVCEILNNLFWM
jgi:hypothetical protein